MGGVLRQREDEGRQTGSVRMGADRQTDRQAGSRLLGQSTTGQESQRGIQIVFKSRETSTDAQRDRETGTGTGTERDRDRDRDTERQTGKEKQRQSQAQRHIQRERQRDTS